MIVKNNQYELLTPSGFQPFSGIQKIIKNKTVLISTDQGQLQCSIDHQVKTPSGFIRADAIRIGDIILPNQVVTHIQDLNGEIEVFDPLDVANGSEYMSDGFISHNCAFLGSSRTLISAAKLITLAAMTPLKEVNSTRLYEAPEQGKLYAITVDVAEGLGGDFSVVMAFDITAAPYKPVYIYQDRYIDVMALPGIIYEVARRYNDAMVLVESNFGQQVANILWTDYEYEHVISTERSIKSIGGFRVGWGSKKQVPGVVMNAQTKRMGCATLKSMIENDQLIVRDAKTIEELKRFSVKNKSYAAETGNDDLVMALVLFGWLAEQGYLRNQNEVDIRGQIANMNQKRIDDAMVVGYHSTGQVADVPVAVSSSNDKWLLDTPDGVPEPNWWNDMKRSEDKGWW